MNRRDFSKGALAASAVLAVPLAAALPIPSLLYGSFEDIKSLPGKFYIQRWNALADLVEQSCQAGTKVHVSPDIASMLLATKRLEYDFGSDDYHALVGTLVNTGNRVYLEFDAKDITFA